MTSESRSLDVVLHIGSGKAGSSSLQFFLRDNRERLAKLGYLYPRTPGEARHGRLGFFIKSEEELEDAPAWARQRQPDLTVFREDFRRQLLSEIQTSGLSRVVISDEALFNASDPALQRLRSFTDPIAERLRVIVYLRRQDDHLVSRYQQIVKTGSVVRLREWAERDRSSLYDYYTCLRRHQSRLAPSEFVVRRFEPESFVDGSLFQDFLDAARIDTRVDELEQGSNRNESLDAESVEFLRLLNLYWTEKEAAVVGRIDNRKFVRRLSSAATGPVLTLPTLFLDEFMTRWEEPNRRVAREFLGDESGELFHRPRKTRHTTTEQHLAPDRLEHFLTLLDLPEHMHSPMRRLVEREATVR